MKKFILLFLLPFFIVNLNAQFCVSHPSPIQNTNSSSNSSSSLSCVPDINFDVTVPVYFHFAQSNFNQVVLTPDQMDEVISSLNTAYQYNSGGITKRINFVLAAFDETGECFDGYKIHDLDGNNIFWLQTDHGSHQATIEKAYPDQIHRDFVVNNYIILIFGLEQKLDVVKLTAHTSHLEVILFSHLV